MNWLLHSILSLSSPTINDLLIPWSRDSPRLTVATKNVNLQGDQAREIPRDGLEQLLIRA